MKKIESVILENLVHNEEYIRHVLPFLTPEYFHNPAEKEVFETIKDFFYKYNTSPSIVALKVEVDNRIISEGIYKEISDVVGEISDRSNVDYAWLIDKSEKFCKDKAVYNAIMKSIQILDGEDKELTKDALPSLLADAIAVSFDTSVGHDLFEDAEERYDLLHEKKNKIRFDIDMLNKITRGGVEKKTLNVFLASTNVGKSLALCHLAASYIRAGMDVLYITLEMAAEKISERVDCNLLSLNIEDLEKVSKEKFISKMDEVERKTQGRLIVKEYPMSSAHSGHFRALLDELDTKKSFKPSVIIIDYLNICSAQRASKNDNSYTLVKKIAEELRALAQEYNVPVWSATQTNRGGANNSDISITDTSESFGLPMTVDFLLALVRTDELDEMGQLLCIQLKSRYNNVAFHRKFVIGVDITMFRLFNVEQSAQDDIVNNDKPAPDKSKFVSNQRNRGAANSFNFD